MKFNFREDRLIFEGFFSEMWGKFTSAFKGDKDEKSSDAPGQPKVDTPAVAPEAAPPKPEEQPPAPTPPSVEVKKDTKEGLTTVKVEMKLDELKGKIEGEMKENFAELGNAISLNGQEVTGVLTGDLNFNSFKEKFSADVIKLLAGRDLNKFTNQINQATGLSVKSEELVGLISAIYANSIINAAQEKFKKDFDRYQKFVELQKKQTPPKTYEIPFKVKMSGITTFVPEFDVAACGFDKDYKDYADKNLTKPEDKKDKPDKQMLEITKKAEFLKDSFSGRALAWLGLVKFEDAPTDRQETAEEKKARETKAYLAIVNGENFIARWVVWLLGGGALLDGGGADIEATVRDWGNTKHGALVLALHQKAEESPLSLKKLAAKYNAGAGVESQADADLKLMDNTEFAGVFGNPDKVPEKGLKLKDVFTVANGQQLKINLKNGGEIVIPKGASVTKVGGEKIGDEKEDKSLKDQEIVVYGQIPAGTTFKGKVQFTLDKLSS